MLMGNVNALLKKMDELSALVKNQRTYQESCLIIDRGMADSPHTGYKCGATWLHCCVICCRDCELLAVSIRPYYLQREFTHVMVICVYIPPRANVEAALKAVHSSTAGLQTQHPDALIVISGDFNHVTLDSTLPALHQHVDCPTWKNKTIDLLYANVRGAYSATPDQV